MFADLIASADLDSITNSVLSNSDRVLSPRPQVTQSLLTQPKCVFSFATPSPFSWMGTSSDWVPRAAAVSDKIIPLLKQVSSRLRVAHSINHASISSSVCAFLAALFCFFGGSSGELGESSLHGEIGRLNSIEAPSRKAALNSSTVVTTLSGGGPGDLSASAVPLL